MPTTDFAQRAERAIANALPHEIRKLAGGGIAAVSDASGRTVTHAFGNAREGVGVDADTVFRIASMSKSFLAAAVLSLRDEGTLDLRAPITAYLPHARLLWQGEPVDVSCAQLLSNRSGLPEDNAWADRNLGLPRDEFEALMTAGLQLALPPGLDYQYSNVGMAVVGAVVEAVTGKPIADVVEERFLEPLGLEHTAYDPVELPASATIADGCRTFDSGNSFAFEPLVADGALGCIGGLFSTVGDVGLWMRFLGSAFTAQPEHPEVLSVGSRLEMQSGFTPAPIPVFRDDLASFAYGYGLFVEGSREHGRIVQHAGGLPGWSSHMRWHTESGLGVVVFGTSDVFSAGKRASVILNELLGGDPPVVQVWPETLETAARIDDLLRTGASLRDLADFAAFNVLMDYPDDVRDARLGELTEQFGRVLQQQDALDARVRAAPNAAELLWRVACERGDLVCTIRLAPLATPLLQSLTIEAAS